MDFPKTVDEITSEWLRHVLRNSGSADQTDVRSFTAESLDGGISGEAYRVYLSFEGGDGTEPRSLIVKQAVKDPDRLKFLNSLGYYEAESNFYSSLARQVGVGIPMVYFAEYEAKSGQFAIVMEDLGHFRSHAYEDNFSRDDTESAIEYLARLHAKWWEDESLNGFRWLKDYRDENAYGPVRDGLLPHVDQFIEKTEGLLPAEFERMFRRFAANYTKAWQCLGDDPVTLTHGDFNKRNLLFDDSTSGWESVVAVDWQLVGRSRSAIDVATIVPQSSAAEQSRDVEMDLLSNYHEQLLDFGVSNYSWDQFLDDYRLGLLVRLGIGARLVATFSTGDPDKDLFMRKRMTDRMKMLIDWNCEEVIPR